MNVVSPGTVITPPYHELFGAELDNVIEHAKSATPFGRLGTSEEIANAVMFLASNESSFITGTELFVDGGAGQI